MLNEVAHRTLLQEDADIVTSMTQDSDSLH